MCLSLQKPVKGDSHSLGGGLRLGKAGLWLMALPIEGSSGEPLAVTAAIL